MNFMLILGILLIGGLASTRITKKLKLPNVTGYLVVGLLLALGCVLIDNFNNNSLLTDELNSLNEITSNIALGFIALSIGEEFKLSKIKEYGSKIIIITIIQALLAAVLVDVVVIGICLLLKLPLHIAICLGAIATATAPAATLMVIQQYKARGPLVDILLPVVAFDDAIGLMVFAISVSISKVIATGSEVSFLSICLIPLLTIIGSILIGFILGWLLHICIKFFRSRNNHLLIIITFTLLGVGTCSALNTIKINNEPLEFSNLLCCMMIGAAFINLAHREDKSIVLRDIDLVEHWTPFLFMLFFVLSGTHLVTSTKSIISSNVPLLSILFIFIGYIIARSLGKYFGAYIGSKITKRTKNISNYLGITLLPQAGVAIGMANQISNMEQFKDASNSGNIIITVILCATLFYEIIGPLLTKWSLNKAGEIPNEYGIYPYELVHEYADEPIKKLD